MNTVPNIFLIGTTNSFVACKRCTMLPMKLRFRTHCKAVLKHELTKNICIKIQLNMLLKQNKLNETFSLIRMPTYSANGEGKSNSRYPPLQFRPEMGYDKRWILICLKRRHQSGARSSSLVTQITIKRSPLTLLVRCIMFNII